MTTITVASIQWPQAGKKTGAIIDSMGKKWVVYADKINQFQAFQSYEIVPKTISFNGRSFDTIETATPVGNLIGGKSAMEQSSTPVRGYTPPSDDQRRMDIFVCGAFNNIMANPNLKPDELPVAEMVSIINILKQAWKQTLGPSAGQYAAGMAKNADMNDEIPF